MSVDGTWIWLLLLGAMHGVNPAMGWLFAVALGLQERSARAVWRALLPLALGHALAIGAAILMAALLGLVVPLGYLKWVVAAALLTFAVRHLVRHGHRRWGGMQVGMRDLAMWSLLMASAHGAGLMVLPVILSEAPEMETVHAHHSQTRLQTRLTDQAAPREHAGPREPETRPTNQAALRGQAALQATLIHSAGYLLVTGLLAVVVYCWAGLRLLRAAWINLDLIWAVALAITAVLTPLL